MNILHIPFAPSLIPPVVMSAVGKPIAGNGTHIIAQFDNLGARTYIGASSPYGNLNFVHRVYAQSQGDEAVFMEHNMDSPAQARRFAMSNYTSGLRRSLNIGTDQIVAWPKQHYTADSSPQNENGALYIERRDQNDSVIVSKTLSSGIGYRYGNVFLETIGSRLFLGFGVASAFGTTTSGNYVRDTNYDTSYAVIMELDPQTLDTVASKGVRASSQAAAFSGPQRLYGGYPDFGTARIHDLGAGYVAFESSVERILSGQGRDDFRHLIVFDPGGNVLYDDPIVGTGRISGGYVANGEVYLYVMDSLYPNVVKLDTELQTLKSIHSKSNYAAGSIGSGGFFADGKLVLSESTYDAENTGDKLWSLCVMDSALTPTLHKRLRVSHPSGVYMLRTSITHSSLTQEIRLSVTPQLVRDGDLESVVIGTDLASLPAGQSITLTNGATLSVEDVALPEFVDVTPIQDMHYRWTYLTTMQRGLPSISITNNPSSPMTTVTDSVLLSLEPGTDTTLQFS